ncbi:MAG: pentapeptide repeat-containing protein [Cyanothece sp. SIO1E1]|nr:pentapeptide repeat-containing protein [Cyanothece sp. SIO1E1]
MTERQYLVLSEQDITRGQGDISKTESHVQPDKPKINGADLREFDFCGQDLSGADLRRQDLRGVNLSEANLSWSNFNWSNLSGANLSRVNFCEAQLSWTNLHDTDLSEAMLHGTDLSGAILRKANLQGAILRKANLRGAVLQGANFYEADLSWVNLSWTDLSQVDLSGRNLSGTDLSGANLSGANLSGANLSGANLSGTDLRYVNLSGANLSEANLSGANLQAVNLNGQNLSGANLSGANLTRTDAIGTNFNQAIFTGATLEDWQINSTTQLDDVMCNYVYLKQRQQKRCPQDESQCLTSEEFSQLFQQRRHTIEFTFNHGINWEAFLYAFRQLQANINDMDALIQAIESTADNAFAVRITFSAKQNPIRVQQYLQQAYRLQLQTIQQRYELKARMEAEHQTQKQVGICTQAHTKLLSMIETIAEGEAAKSRVGFNVSG